MDTKQMARIWVGLALLAVCCCAWLRAGTSVGARKGAAEGHPRIIVCGSTSKTPRPGPRAPGDAKIDSGSSPVPNVPPPLAADDPRAVRREAAIDALRLLCPQLDSSRVYPEEGYSPDDKRVAGLSAGNGRLTGPSDLPPEEAALAFLSEYRDIWGIQDVERDLELDPGGSRSKPDTSGMTHMHFRQVVSGVPLLGDGLRVTMDRDGSIVWVDGTIEPLAIGAPLDSDPSIDDDRALEVAVARHGPVSHGTPDVELVARFDGQGVRLCWSVEYTGNGWWHLLIDADDGQVLREVDKVCRADYAQVRVPAVTPFGRRVSLAARMYHPDSDRPIWSLLDMTLRASVYTGFAPPGANDWLRGAGTTDFQNRTGVFSSGLERSGTAAHRNLGRILLHWREVLGRDSYDDEGGNVRCTVNGALDGNPNNAWYAGDGAFWFGEGDGVRSRSVTALDVCAHEFGHAVFDALIHPNAQQSNAQTYAVDEHVADAFALFTERSLLNESRRWNWSIGEEVILRGTRGVMRDMANPHLLRMPDHYSEVRADNDEHDNACVLNKFLYLWICGGVHPQSGRAVVGLIPAFGGGEERAFRVARRAYYLSLKKLTPAVCFRRFRKALYDVVRVEYGEDSTVYRQAAAAFAAIGL